MNRGDVLALVQEWRSLVRGKRDWLDAADPKDALLGVGRVMDDFANLGNKMAKTLEEIARQ